MNQLRQWALFLVAPLSITLRVRPGDTMNVVMTNNLPPQSPAPTTCVSPPACCGANASCDPACATYVTCVNTPTDFNTTNLHTHGLHVSPAGVADNVFVAIPPGQAFKYEIKIPRNHPAGTYWYHAHVHGATTVQVASGMLGMLIVEGDIDEVPEIKAAKEQVLVLQQPQYAVDSSGVGTIEPTQTSTFAGTFGGTSWQDSPAPAMVSGKVQPTYHMRPGEVQRFRLLNASFGQGIGVQIREKGADSGASEPPLKVMYRFARDGITTGRLDNLDTITMYPGYREDTLVKAPDMPGTYVLYDSLAAAPTTCATPPCTAYVSHTNLATIVVEGEPVSMALPSVEVLLKLKPYRDVAEGEVMKKRSMTFNLGVPPGASAKAYQVGVDGPATSFNPDATPLQVPLGSVEEWSLCATGGGGHPFHIHTNPFQVMNEPGALGQDWKDTYQVPSATGTPTPTCPDPSSQVTIRTRFRDYIGTFVLHCHILDHEDQGMMQEVEVVGTSSHHHGAHHPPR